MKAGRFKTVVMPLFQKTRLLMKSNTIQEP